jgi:hypothetical protein
VDDDRRERAEHLLKEVLGEPAPASTWHRLRANVLELTTTTEHRIDEILAAGTARTVALGDTLAADVLWRLQTNVRLKLLEELMERHGLADEFPFIIPVLRRLFDFRHLLAHGYASPVRLDQQPLTLRIQTVRRGQIEERCYPLTEIAWLVLQVDVIQRELVQVWAAVVPDDPAWHEV